MPIEIKSVQADKEKPDVSRFFGLFISRSAAGKSCASMSFKREGQCGKVLDFDLRKGYVGQSFLPLKGWTVHQFPPLITYMEHVEKELEAMSSLYKTGQWPYDCVIIDSLGPMCRVLLTDSLEYTKGNTKGKTRLSGPPDYNYQSQALLQIFDYLRSLPCHVIVNCHISRRWGPGSKKDSQGNLIEYQDQEVIGEELAGVTNKLGEIIPGYFDEIYKFSRSEDGSRFYVEFYTDIARTIFKFPRGKQDITGKNFYQYWLELVKKSQGVEDGTTV